jgi:RNA polymerase sigma-70 factor (ECF subfamily)
MLLMASAAATSRLLFERGSMTQAQTPKDFADQLLRAQPQIYGYVYSLVPNTDAAMEVLQETNLVLWRKANEFAGGNFFAWACSVARFCVLSYRRDMAREKRVFTDDLIEELADEFAQRIPRVNLMAEALERCLDKLNSDDRELLNARYSSGGSVAGVAAQQGKTVNAISRVCYRLRGILLACISRTLAGEGAA